MHKKIAKPPGIKNNSKCRRHHHRMQQQQHPLKNRKVDAIYVRKKIS